ncbi:hypothetical protein BLNAU_13646 [Blattamonas nauphoetae]|uniref:Myb-like domain-containing protein n=1 Tax=Blattamonas nauphoetae TaxID=2049346 RepID=A0ABQ9XKX9_9EUKA|nr:hypothetical protein BLNAU_13646 [Blattamonas nauphoetae]
MDHPAPQPEMNEDLNDLERDIINDWLDLKEGEGEKMADRDLEEEWLRVYAGRPRITERQAPIQFTVVPSDAYQSNVGTSGLFRFITSTTPEQQINPKPNAVPYSLETQQKHRWAYRLWELYCNQFKISPLFPLNPQAVTDFIYMLGKNSILRISSLSKPLRGALLALNSIHTGQPTSEFLKWTIKGAVELAKNSKETPDTSCEKPPCLISDLTIILDHIPDLHPKKAFESSLFLFSICCGARASTCAEVRLADVLRVVCLPDTEVLLVTFRLRKMKGSQSTTMNVTMEGSPFAKETVNVIYWMEKHLRSSFGLSLITFETWGSWIDLETRIWGCGTDAMRTQFQKRAFQAGFPINLFGFHSFRSGFISSAIIKAGEDPEARARVLEQCAIVAKWIPFSSTEMGYVKTSTIGVHVANRLVQPNATLHSSNVLEKTLTLSEIFHNIKLKPVKWSGSELYKAFYHECLCWIVLACIGRDESVGRERTLFRKASNLYSRSQGFQGSHVQSVEAAHVSILDSLRNGADSRSLCLQLLSFVRDDLVFDATPQESSEIHCVEGTAVRRRRMWKNWETNILREGMACGKSWVEISKDLTKQGSIRTNVNVKDKWRNEVEKKMRELKNADQLKREDVGRELSGEGTIHKRRRGRRSRLSIVFEKARMQMEQKEPEQRDEEREQE